MEESVGKWVASGSAARAGAAVAGVADPVSAPPVGSMFVINLCASMAPIQSPGKTLPGMEAFKLYQVSRAEDGRTRYRLRLGFFMSEAHADSVLGSVRGQYPTAFTTCICEEDRRFARGYLPENKLPVKPQAAAPSVAPAARPAVGSQPAVDPSASSRVRALQVVPTATAPRNPVKNLNDALPNTAAQPASNPRPVTARPAAVPPAAAPEDSRPILVRRQPANPAPANPAPVVAAPRPSPLTRPPALATSEPEPVRPAAPVRQPPPQANPPSGTERSSNTGSFKVASAAAPASNTGSFKAASKPTDAAATTGSFKTAASLSSTGSFKAAAAAATGSLKALAASRAAAVNQAPEAVPPAIAARSSTLSPTFELTLEPEATPATPMAEAGTPSQPFHVGKGVDIPSSSLTLNGNSEAPRQASPGPTTRPLATGRPLQNGSSVAGSLKPAAPKAPDAINGVLVGRMSISRPGTPPPDFDSTQTIRPLSAAELDDDTQEKWFAIQLAVSDQPANLDTMPHLDIFEAYRLYSVAGTSTGRLMHSLRLGFFRESISADAVGGYLKAFFPATSVVRISAAEQARFSDAPLRTAPEGAASDPNVMELSQASRPAPKPAIPTVTLEVPRSISSPMLDPSNSGSFKLSQSGKYKALKSASKTAAPAVKRAKLLESDAESKLSATGRHLATGKQVATGKHMATGKHLATGKHSATGKHLATGRQSMTGKNKAAIPQPRRSLQEELLAEARQVALSESAIQKLPKSNSLLSRLVGKLTK